MAFTGAVGEAGRRKRRTLVLSAFPGEADAVLSHTALDPDPVAIAGGRHFYLGAIAGKKVIVAMTGIGLVNATDTTVAALARFGIGAVVFSGVAGGAGRTRIADVAVPARWTLDHGRTFRPVDSDMLGEAGKLSVALESVVRRIDLRRRPRVVVGGDGCSWDNNNGVAFPCIPNGGDVFGCQPRTAPDWSRRYTGNFRQAAGRWLRSALISNLKIVSSADRPSTRRTWRPRRPRLWPTSTASRSSASAALRTGRATRFACRAFPFSSSATKGSRRSTPPG